MRTSSGTSLIFDSSCSFPLSLSKVSSLCDFSLWGDGGEGIWAFSFFSFSIEARAFFNSFKLSLSRFLGDGMLDTGFSFKSVAMGNAFGVSFWISGARGSLRGGKGYSLFFSAFEFHI